MVKARGPRFVRVPLASRASLGAQSGRASSAPYKHCGRGSAALRQQFVLFHLLELLLQIRHKLRLNVGFHFVCRRQRGVVRIPG